MQRERQLFDACLDLPPAERGPFLDRECGSDTALRQRLDRLLAAHHQPTFAPLSLPHDPGTPERIGRYELLRVIGEGGMGTVYEARQTEPIVRHVAIKVIRLGGLSKPLSAEILSRFANEQQALAVMDHPNVAKVYDAGETHLGCPYFAMEFVDGHPLTGYCESHKLPLPEKLRIFLQLCHAVQHAHQKGVIHRDLKPANVLVTGPPSEPIAKVIDFGIAKAVGDPNFAAHHTQTGLPIGTAAYMSPEQAGFGARDIDTRSDIYSLGVLLYELIAGKLPADPNDSGYASFLGQLATGNLHITPPTTNRADADLDAITLKALDPDRARRYQSAAALAEDIERFLHNQPISARRLTLSYRLSKYIRRNRFQAAAAAIAILAVLAGSIAATAGYLRAIRAEAIAREEAATAGEVSDFLINTFKVNDPGESRGRSVTARELLENATSQIDTRLGQSPTVRQRLLTTLSRAYSSLGLYTDGRSMAEKALASLPAAGAESLEDADALVAFSAAAWPKDQYTDAASAATRATAIRTRLLGSNHPKVAEAMLALSTVHMKMDRFDDALDLAQSALTIRRQSLGPEHVETGSTLRAIGSIYVRRGKPGDTKLALQHHQQSLAILGARLGKDHPQYASNLDDIGLCMAKPADALPYYQQSLAIRQRVLGPDHVHTSFSHYNLGRALLRLGKLDEARRHLETALALRKAKLGASSTLTGDVTRSLAMLETGTGNLKAAFALFEQALSISSASYGPDHSVTLLDRSNFGIILAAMKRFDEALPHLRAGLRAQVYFRWQDKHFDPVRKDPRYLALAAEQERIQATGRQEGRFQYTAPK